MTCRLTEHVRARGPLPAKPEPCAELAISDSGRGMSSLMLPFIGDALPCASRWEVEESQGAVRVKVYQVGAPGGTEPSMYLLRPAKQGHALIAAHEKGRTVGFFCYGDGGGDELDDSGLPKILRHRSWFDSEHEPFDDMRETYAPLVWQ